MKSGAVSGVRGMLKFWRCGQVATVLAVLSGFPGLSPAEPLHSLRMGQYPTQAQAEQARNRLDDIATPSFVKTDSSASTTAPHLLLTGHFTSKAQAWVYKAKLAERMTTVTEAPIYEWEAGTTVEQANVLPIRRPFRLNDLTSAALASRESIWDGVSSAGLSVSTPPSASTLSKPVTAMTRNELLEVGLGAPDNSTTGVSALERLLSDYPNDEAVNRCRLRLARRLLPNDPGRAAALLDEVTSTAGPLEQSFAKLYRAYHKNRYSTPAEASAAFSAVAEDPSVPIGLRRNAMRQVAGIAQRIKDIPTAWLAYEQVEASAGSNEDRAEARMQLGALAFELASREKGTWEDAREFCESVLAMPGARRADRATAALMHLETYFFDGNTTQALVEVEQFVTEYADVKREWITGLNWKGKILCKLERFSEAATVFRQVVQSTVLPSEKFANREPRAEAARWLVWLAKMRNDTVEAQAQLALLQNEFPDAPETQEARAILGETVPPPAIVR